MRVALSHGRHIIDIVLDIERPRDQRSAFRSVELEIPSVNVSCRRTHLEQVSGHIEPSFLPAIDGFHPPIEDDIVHELHRATPEEQVLPAIDGRMVKPWIAAVVGHYEIVMEGHVTTTPYTSVAMLSLAMHRAVESLGDYAPLHRGIGICIKGRILVSSPAYGTMVYHDIVAMPHLKRVILLPSGTSHPESHIPHDNLVRDDMYPEVAQSDPATRSSLPEDSEIRLGYPKRLLQTDVTAHGKGHYTRPLGLHGMP